MRLPRGALGLEMYGEETEGEESLSEGQVKHLQAVLEHETNSRQQQEVFNSKLQEEYDVLLKKLAEAELHIDRLRLRANVDVNKRFIVTHNTIQASVLQQGLGVSYSPGTAGWRGGEGDTVGITGKEDMPGRAEDGEYWETTQSPQDSGRTPVSIHNYSSLPPHSHVPQNEGHVQHDFNEETCLQQHDFSQSLLHDYGAPGNLLSVSHLSQALSDASLSQMSTSYIKTHASAESQHLAQLFRVRSLQEQIAALKAKLNTDRASFDELSEDLGHILEEHEELAGSFSSSGQQLESLQDKYKDRASAEIAQRNSALENEVNFRF